MWLARCLNAPHLYDLRSSPPRQLGSFETPCQPCSGIVPWLVHSDRAAGPGGDDGGGSGRSVWSEGAPLGRAACVARRECRRAELAQHRAVALEVKRPAWRGGSVDSHVTLGGRQVEVPRLRVRSAEGEVPLASFQWAAWTDPLDEHTLAAVAARVSTRRHAGALDPGCTTSSLDGVMRRAGMRCTVAGANAMSPCEAGTAGGLSARHEPGTGRAPLPRPASATAPPSTVPPGTAPRACAHPLMRSPGLRGTRSSGSVECVSGIVGVLPNQGIGRAALAQFPVRQSLTFVSCTRAANSA